MIVLDGATGTELGRRGVDTRGALFSAAALLSEEGIAALRAVHAAYVQAGAQVITANTFRTNPRKAGGRWRELTRLAVRIARLSNCAPPAGVDVGLGAAAASGLPFGAYAHMGEVDPHSGWPVTPVLAPEEYAARAAGWFGRGASILGGCCGTTPAHIAALAALSPIRHDPCQSDRRIAR